MNGEEKSRRNKPDITMIMMMMMMMMTMVMMATMVLMIVYTKTSFCFYANRSR